MYSPTLCALVLNTATPRSIQSSNNPWPIGERVLSPALWTASLTSLLFPSVDRKKSVEVLEDFLSGREWLIKNEVKWLKDHDITCVLSDAVFIAW